MNQEPSPCLHVITTSSFKRGVGGKRGTKPTDPVSPVFPVIFSQGWSVMMLRSRGVISGVSDHRRTVLSLLQLAMVNGRL